MTRQRLKTIPSLGPSGQRGYTLIELAVVIVLIGVVLLMAVPRIQDTMTQDRMRSAVRHLAGTARELKAEAVREQVDHYLHLDLDNRLVWNTRDDMTAETRTLRRSQARSLPSGVRITDVALVDAGKKTQGEVVIRFFSQGYVQPTAIHLTDEDRIMTLILQPFLSTVEVQDTYVDAWQTSK
ncbi:MAG TPA: prepilin-type N-terminal cleavage/methylation domain-containing protein [Syntrophales bacterium]|nr:prepilin-type N-terminal cleavage/methylation domain-containing protein [Syntrophales bacterium]